MQLTDYGGVYKDESPGVWITPQGSDVCCPLCKS